MEPSETHSAITGLVTVDFNFETLQVSSYLHFWVHFITFIELSFEF